MAQLSFAAFHFLVTFLTLFFLSRQWLPGGALFTPRRIPFLSILPISVAMALNVILPNLSLAFSTVTFYQIARILLTPTVAALNFFLYGATLPRRAVLTLIPTSLGVAAVSYYDSQPPPNSTDLDVPKRTIQMTQPLGILFALLGTFASSLYTVWIGAYHRRYQLSSMQLLYNQAPVAFAILLYVIPFIDVLPTWDDLRQATEHDEKNWHELGGLISLSGLFAALINISQFFIVANAGAVSSTMVGHVKTCLIVILGWIVSGRGLVGGGKCLMGVVTALGGIIA